MGMAFTDTIVSETDATVVLVDRGHQPGGHWGRGFRLLRPGHAAAVAADGTRPVFPDERVSQGRSVPTLAGDEYTVTCQSVVDATDMRTIVPSMRLPEYAIAGEIDCVPPNDLPTRAVGKERYVIVGAGKTGIDVRLWLLRHATRGCWTARRRSRAAVGRASLETAEPMYRCATVTGAELEQLRRITDVVRKGHVKAIEPQSILLEGGKIPTAAARCSTVTGSRCRACAAASRYSALRTPVPHPDSQI
jgi:hypothetical protein